MDYSLPDDLTCASPLKFTATSAHRYDLIPLNKRDAPQIELANMPFDIDYNRYLHGVLSTFVDRYGLLRQGWNDILVLPQNRNEPWLCLSATDVTADPIYIRDMDANLYANDWDPDSIPEDDDDFQSKRKAEIVWPILVVTVPEQGLPIWRISQELRAAMQEIIGKIQALIAVGNIWYRVPDEEYQAVLVAVKEFEEQGGVTIAFHKSLNAALRQGLYRLQNGSLFLYCKETQPQMTLAQRVEAVMAVGFWIERFNNNNNSEGVEYLYFSNDLRQKYGDVMLYLRAEPPRDDSGGRCNYSSDLFRDEQGWLRVMW